MPTLTILTGGQTGVDQGVLRAARARGLPTGGFAPKGWLTEDGPAPWLAEWGLQECPEAGYPARTRRNVQAAWALLWLGNPGSAGGRLTLRLARQQSLHHKIFAHVGRVAPDDIEVAAWLQDQVMRGRYDAALLVAGNRESACPGIGAWAERFLGSVLNLFI